MWKKSEPAAGGRGELVTGRRHPHRRAARRLLPWQEADRPRSRKRTGARDQKSTVVENSTESGVT